MSNVRRRRKHQSVKHVAAVHCTAVPGRPSARPANHRSFRNAALPALEWAVRPLAASEPSAVLGRRCATLVFHRRLSVEAHIKEQRHMSQTTSAQREQPKVGARVWQPFISLALCRAAAPRRKASGSTGVARATAAVPLRRHAVSNSGLGSARRAVAHGRVPNTAVNRTSNSGLRPLSAAGYLRR